MIKTLKIIRVKIWQIWKRLLVHVIKKDFICSIVETWLLRLKITPTYLYLNIWVAGWKSTRSKK
jgi:hypothetical protein